MVGNVRYINLFVTKYQLTHRPVTIKSVLDVRDDTPLPRHTTPATRIGRSILILTPQRALKLTASTFERHHIWMTALAFLSHSSVVSAPLAPPTREAPAPPRPQPPQPQSSARLHRSPIRDSVHIAKGKARPVFDARRTQSSPMSSVAHNPPTSFLTEGDDDDDHDGQAAEPPLVPRFSRKRSIGSAAPTASSVRSYHTASGGMPSAHSLLSSEGSHGRGADRGGSGGGGRSSALTGRMGGSLVGSLVGGRTSRATGASTPSGRSSALDGREAQMQYPSPIPEVGLFESIGTIKMEAFIRGVENGLGGAGAGAGPGGGLFVMEGRKSRRGSSTDPMSVGGSRRGERTGMSGRGKFMADRAVGVGGDPFEGF